MEPRSLSDMTRRQHPLTMPPTATVQQAAQRMSDRHVGAVLVTDEEGRLLGIFTGRDAVCRMLAAAQDAAHTTLDQVMTADPVVMPAGSTAMDALRLMQDGGFRHVPVVQEGRVIGIVSRGDFRGLEQARLDEETGFFEVLR